VTQLTAPGMAIQPLVFRRLPIFVYGDPRQSVIILFLKHSELTMPIYEYRCRTCGFEKEYLQKLSDAPIELCESCGKATMSKLLSAAGFQLKGSGWYATDFKNPPGKAKPSEADNKDSAGKEPAGKESTGKESAGKESPNKESASKDRSAAAADSSAPRNAAPEAALRATDRSGA
jgi:putative FmdB family regulatory protein